MGEWGRVNSGQDWGAIAFDVDRALACAGLTMYEAIIVQFVREHSWGPGFRKKRKKGEPRSEAKPVRVDLTALSCALAVPYQRLYEAVKRLERSRILTAAGRGHLLNKDADTWVSPSKADEARLTEEMLDYAREAQDADPSEDSFTPERENASESDFTPEREPSANGFTFSRDPSTKLFTPERDPSEKTFTQKREVPNKEDAPARSGEREKKNQDSESVGSVSDRPSEFVLICREAQKIDALKAAGFPKRLHDDWPKDGKLQATWHMTRPDSWRKALVELAGSDPSKMVPRYYLTIVSRIDAKPATAPASPTSDRTAATTSRPACQANPRNILTRESILKD